MVGGVMPLLLLSLVSLSQAQVMMMMMMIMMMSFAQIIPTYFETGPGNLPTDTDISVTVVVDDAWATKEGMGAAEIENTLRPVIQGYNSGKLEVTDFRQINVGDTANISEKVDFGKKKVTLTCHYLDNKRAPGSSSRWPTATTPT